MPRRHRPVSASSVESVDEGRIRWRPDDSVLKTVLDDQALEGEWPCFEVKDAVVYNKDGKTLENALAVASKGPFIVRGHLVIDRSDTDQTSRLLVPTRGPTPIETNACIRYSVGLSEDGDQPVIWVSGSAGWYEITPAPEYRPIYKDMCNAVRFYYRIQDAYHQIYPPNSRRGIKTKTKSIAQELANVFLQYAVAVGDGILLHELIQRVVQWESFLVNQMSNEDPDIFTWKTTAFHQLLNAGHKDLQRELENIFLTLDIGNSTAHEVLGKKIPAAPATLDAPQTRARSSSSSVATGSPSPNTLSNQATHTSDNARSASISSQSQGIVPVRSKTSEPPTSLPESSDGDNLPLQSVVDAVEWAFDRYRKSSRTKDFQARTCFSHMYLQYAFPSSTPYSLPIEDVLAYNAKGLLQKLDPGKYNGHQFWDYLLEQANKPFVPQQLTLSDFPYTLRARKKMSRTKPTDNLPRAGSTMQIMDDDDDADVLITPRRGKAPKGPRPSHSGLRLARKRTHDDVTSDSDVDSNPKRSQQYTEEESLEDADSPTGNKNGETPMETTIKLVIRADKIPSITPRGPDNTWQCEEDDCAFVVRGGEEDERQERIQEHLLEHEEGASRISLALTESRGYMPVDHLLEKLKKSGQNKLPDLELNGVRLQRPINRRLLV